MVSAYVVAKRHGKVMTKANKSLILWRSYWMLTLEQHSLGQLKRFFELVSLPTIMAAG